MKQINAGCTVKEFLQFAQPHLVDCGPMEIYGILAHVLNVSRLDVMCDLGRKLTQQELERLEEMINQCAAGKPLGKVLGYTHFYGHKFIVNEHVLDPRPETEELVEWIVESTKYQRILDLGVGSGCIILSLIKANTNSSGVGVDVSKQALEVANKNARALGLEADLIESHWLDNVPAQKFDLIVSNPPYVNRGEEVGPETIYDPAEALYAQGAEHYLTIIKGAKDFLARDGSLFFELPKDYESQIQEWATEYGFIAEWKSSGASNISFCKLKWHLGLGVKADI